MINVLPVIVREMRVSARQPVTYWSRWIVVGGAFIACSLIYISYHGSRGMGQSMLYVMGLVLEVVALLSGCLLTADCLSAERRNGTLDLLFLTKLSSVEIVLGKMAASSLQTGLCFLAAFPVFFLPVLVGGVIWNQVVVGMVVIFISFFLSLSIGALFSALSSDASKNTLRTLFTILALTTGPILFLVMVNIAGNAGSTINRIAQFSPGYLWHQSTVQLPGMGFKIPGFWQSLSFLLFTSIVLVFASAYLLRKMFLSERSIPAPADTPLQSFRPRREHSFGSYTLPAFFKVLKILLLAFCFGSLSVFVYLHQLVTHEYFVTACFTVLGIHIIHKIVAVATVARALAADRNSGVVEILLTTPVDPARILHDCFNVHYRAYARSEWLLIGLNLLLFAFTLLFWKSLSVGKDNFLVFVALFLGGLATPRSDFKTIIWLNAYHILRSGVFWKSALKTASIITFLPWIFFFIVMAIMVGSNNDNEEMYFFLFLSTPVFSMILNRFQRSRAEWRLKNHFRELAAGEPIKFG